MKREKMYKKRDLSFYIFGASFFMIVIGIIHYKPSVFLFIPLLVSAVVMLLQSRVNSYAFMVGAVNAVLLAIAHMKMALYATALYAILVSFPLQVRSFLNWSKHTTQNNTELRKMSIKTKIEFFGGMVASWGLLYMIFLKFNSQYLLLDNSVAVLGIISTILCVLRFKEYTFLQLLTQLTSLGTYLMMLKEEPSRIIWVISSANGVVCSCLAWLNMNKSDAHQ